MPCYKPVRTVLDGNHNLHFSRDWKNAQHFDGESVVNIPCRKCIGCKQGIQRDWAVRCFHEAQLHTTQWTEPLTRVTTEIPNSCFITLTYDDEHMPKDQVLEHGDFQRFMKRLRIRRQRRHEKIGLVVPTKPIRYFMCGEYGGKTARPHYHSIIFGETFDDQYTFTENNKLITMSYELDDLWSQPAYDNGPVTNIGRATVDPFSFAGASYVAGYVAKKAAIFGDQGPIKEAIDGHGAVTFAPLSPEYRRMSTHPGLGADWIRKPENLAAVYENDCVKISESTFHPPKYYDSILEQERPDLVADIIKQRLADCARASQEWSKERCASAESIALESLQQRRDSL